MLELIEYGGWLRNARLTNGRIELVATLEVGPRILRFAPVGGANVMHENPGQLGGTGEDRWMPRGGHRLWHAPEARPRTYLPDNDPVEYTELGDYGMRLTQAPEEGSGIQKAMTVTMAAEDDVVIVEHTLTNFGPWPVELAPWALTVLAPGGMAIAPLPEKRTHYEALTPEFPLVMWPYTDMSDPRFRWGSRYITLRQEAGYGPTKFGMGCSEGWAAYALNGLLFVKYFNYEDEQYPDGGCNLEAFTAEGMLELETLGPLNLLEPGETVEHIETWRLFADVPPVDDDESIDRVVKPLVEG
jgi:hypothetical protein